MWKLIKTINATDPGNALDEKRLERSFDKWWEVFDNGLKAIRLKHRTVVKAPERPEKELVAEILDISRAIQRAVERIESKEKLGVPISSTDVLSGITPGDFYWQQIPKLPPLLQTIKVADLLKKVESGKEAEKKAEKEAEKKTDARKPPT